MNKNEKISYVELPAKDIQVAKFFFTKAFGWSFTDYGPDYTAFSEAGIDGGFYTSSLSATTQTGTALIVFYSEHLEKTETKLKGLDALIIQPIFSFPGGRRFHFTDPNGNEYGMWSNK